MKKLFGKNIETACEYCQNYNPGAEFPCELGRKINANGKCKKFNYNPTLRTPKAEAVMMQFSKEEFEI